MRLDVDRISVIRGEDLVLNDVSFSLESGEALVVKGANGSGKSTLLRALAGLLPLENGTVRLSGFSDNDDASALENLSHYLGHENAMKPTLTVQENLSFWRNFDGQPDLEVSEALDFVGLGGLETVPFAHLSTGQRRRIAIARLLVSARPVWLLDEPTAGLDAASEAQFSNLMAAHLDDGGMIVAATHVPLGLENTRELIFGPAA